MFPRWLSLLILGLLGYLMVLGNTHHAVKPAVPVTEQATTTPTTPAEKSLIPDVANYPALNAATDLERWKRTINPSYAEHSACVFTAKAKGLALKTIEDTEGAGDGAKCNDTITVKLTIWSNRGAAFYTGEVPLVLGNKQVAAGLDAALIGIKPGGTRTIILPPEALARDPKSDAPRALLHAFKPDIVSVVTATRTH